MVFKPTPCATRWEGIAASFWVLLLDLLLIVWAVRRPSDTLKFILIVMVVASVPVVVHLLYRTWAAFTLEYWVDRNAITMRWANYRQIIPLPSIARIVEGRDLAIGPPGILEWPVPYLRTIVVPGGRLQLCATRPTSECLLLDTPAGVFALSPAQPQAFLDLVQERYQMGPALSLKPALTRQSGLDRLVPSDRLGAWLFGLGLLGVLMLFGVLMISFPDLPDVLTVRYNSAGLPEEIREKSALFRLPIIGLLAWGINGVGGLILLARRQLLGAYMLWGGAIVVQVFTLLALVSLIT